jgi:predicted transposase/invertase (TIGR01784 family)
MNKNNDHNGTREMQYERLDPKNDFLFKKLFSSPGNEDLLIDLLNSILKPVEGQQIYQVTIANPIKEKDSVDDKLAIMDIVAKADDGRQLTIEIQVTDEHNMEKRALYYWATLFASQTHIGMPYEELKKTIGINILDYRLWEQTERYHTRFLPLEKSEGFLLTDTAEIHFIELRKMYRKWKAGELQGSRDPLYRWFLLLMATEDKKISEELEEIAMSDSIIKKAVEQWDWLSQDEETRARYRSRMMAESDRASALLKAEQRGERRGERKGRIKTAKMALQAGVSLETISQITGLDQAAILKLKEKQEHNTLNNKE